jgi:putative heme iron utilization protein
MCWQAIFTKTMAAESNRTGNCMNSQTHDIVKEIMVACPVEATLIIGGQTVKSINNDILKWNVKNSLIIVVGEEELLLPTILNCSCSESPF